LQFPCHERKPRRSSLYDSDKKCFDFRVNLDSDWLWDNLRPDKSWDLVSLEAFTFDNNPQIFFLGWVGCLESRLRVWGWISLGFAPALILELVSLFAFVILSSVVVLTMGCTVRVVRYDSAFSPLFFLVYFLFFLVRSLRKDFVRNEVILTVSFLYICGLLVDLLLMCSSIDSWSGTVSVGTFAQAPHMFAQSWMFLWARDRSCRVDLVLTQWVYLKYVALEEFDLIRTRVWESEYLGPKFFGCIASIKLFF